MSNESVSIYLDLVRQQLESDLSKDELDMLCSDLRDQIMDLGESNATEQLGSPKEFAEAYRATAGIEPRSQKSAWSLWAWLDARRESYVGRVWAKYQDAWWLIRGWLLLLAYALVYSPQPTFRPFPIPNVNELPTTSFVLLVGFTVGSLLMARTTRWPTGRILNILISAFTAYVSLVAAVNT